MTAKPCFCPEHTTQLARMHGALASRTISPGPPSSNAPFQRKLSSASLEPLAVLAAASTICAAVPQPSLDQWLAPFCGGVSLLPPHADPALCVTVWHSATQHLMSCSPNFAMLVDRSPLQLQRGYAWPSLFLSAEVLSGVATPMVARSRALLDDAFARVARGAKGGAAVVMTALGKQQHQHHQQQQYYRWLHFEFAPMPQASAGTVLAFIREVHPASEPWVKLMETELHNEEKDKHLVAAPIKRRNGVVHPWDASTRHFKLTGT